MKDLFSQRDYNSISPSAKSLLLMKGFTNIPFAKEAAALLIHPAPYQPDFTNKDAFFWARLLHFENRYWSIDQLLSDLSITNVLELSSGFSFRGLQMVQEKKIHYIDTDLDDIIETKKKFLQQLPAPASTSGQLETLPLNALDEKNFDQLVAHFPPGEIVIVNEGLLMYLGMEEKEKVCSIIHRLLKQRGGYWITADVYIKRVISEASLHLDDRAKEFFEQHRIEENKFESFEDASDFFSRCGFTIDKVAQPDHDKLTSLKHLLAAADPAEMANRKKSGRFQATWRLKCSG